MPLHNSIHGYLKDYLAWVTKTFSPLNGEIREFEFLSIFNLKHFSFIMFSYLLLVAEYEMFNN